jgi:hypothetical protein
LTLEHASAELRGALAAAAAETLTLEQAAVESGFSTDHLRHLVASGALGRPALRAARCPRRRARPRRAPRTMRTRMRSR